MIGTDWVDTDDDFDDVSGSGFLLPIFTIFIVLVYVFVKKMMKMKNTKPFMYWFKNDEDVDYFSKNNSNIIDPNYICDDNSNDIYDTYVFRDSWSASTYWAEACSITNSITFAFWSVSVRNCR